MISEAMAKRVVMRYRPFSDPINFLSNLRYSKKASGIVIKTDDGYRYDEALLLSHLAKMNKQRKKYKKRSQPNVVEMQDSFTTGVFDKTTAQTNTTHVYGLNTYAFKILKTLSALNGTTIEQEMAKVTNKYINTLEDLVDNVNK